MSRYKVLIRILVVILALIIFSGLYKTERNGRDIFATGEGDLPAYSNVFFTGDIDGAITGEAYYYRLGAGDEEYLIMPTREGIYIIIQNQLKLFIKTDDVVLETEVIPDIDGDGLSDIVAVVRSEFFPNVRAYSSSSGKVLWACRISRPYYDELFAVEMEKNLTILDVNVVDKSTDKSYITLISDYSIVALSAKSGKKLWEYKDRDNIWKVCAVPDINGNEYMDIIFGNQLGEIKALDGKNGSLLWKRKIIEDFTVRSIRKADEKVTRSVWDILPGYNPDNASVVVSGEDGYIYEIDIYNGNVLRQTNVCNFTEDYLNSYYDNQRNMYSPDVVPTGIFHEMFFGLKLFAVADVTGDGKNDFIAAQNIGFSKSSDFLYGSFRIDRPELNRYVSLIDGVNLNVLWTVDITEETAGVEYTEPVVRELDNKKYILLPGSYNQSNLTFISIDASDGKMSNGFILKLNPQFRQKEIYTYKHILRESQQGDVYLGIIDLHSAILKNGLDEVITEFAPGFYSTYIKLDQKVLKIQQLSDNSQQISAHETENLNMIWKYTPEDTGINGAEGFADVTPVGDFNDDGSGDIMLRVLPGTQASDGYIYKIISGKDGSEIYSFEVKNPGGKIFFLGDLNNDKFPDFLVFTETECYRLISEARGGSVVYSKDDKIIKYNGLLQSIDQNDLIGDIDGDNVKDFFIYMMENESGYVSVFSGKTMNKLYDIKNFMEEYFYFTKYDFDNDGVPDYIRYAPYMGGVTVVSAKNQKDIFYLPVAGVDSYTYDYKHRIPADKGYIGMFYGYDIPVITAVGDMTGDGRTEYAIAFSLSKGMEDSRNGVELRVFDLAKGNTEPVKTFFIPSESRELYGEISIIPLTEVKGNNENNFILVEKYNECLLFDMKKWEPVISFTADNVTEAFIQGDDLLVFGSSYEKIDTSYKFGILNLKTGDNTVSPVNLKWNVNKNSNFSVTRIYVDDVYSAISYSDETVLTIRKGDHKITVKYTDEFGKSYYAQIYLSINKSGMLLFFLGIAFLAAVAVMALFVIMPSARLKRVLKRRVRKDELPGDISQ